MKETFDLYLHITGNGGDLADVEAIISTPGGETVERGFQIPRRTLRLVFPKLSLLGEAATVIDMPDGVARPRELPVAVAPPAPPPAITEVAVPERMRQYPGLVKAHLARHAPGSTPADRARPEHAQDFLLALRAGFNTKSFHLVSLLGSMPDEWARYGWARKTHPGGAVSFEPQGDCIGYVERNGKIGFTPKSYPVVRKLARTLLKRPLPVQRTYVLHALRQRFNSPVSHVLAGLRNADVQARQVWAVPAEAVFPSN